jgi:hypothetical protein
MTDSRKDELCNLSFHMKAPTFGVPIAGYEALAKQGFHSVSVQRSTVGRNGRCKTDHMLWVGSPKFRSAAEASRFMQYVASEGDKALEDYTIGEIGVVWKAFRVKENAVEAHGAAQAVDVDADVGEMESEDNEDKEDKDKEEEEDKSQGGERRTKWGFGW